MRDALAALPGGRRRLVLPTLLAVTFLGTFVNYIVNVPVRTIASDFHAPVQAGVLVVSAYVITLAAALPLSGWAGDRIGRRRVLVAALTLMTVAQVAAALAPSLPVLVALRAVQGLACAAIPAAVMGLLARATPTDRRGRALSAWAAANGIGQAVGPPFGGVVADVWGWRGIFWLLVPLTIAVLAASVACLPNDRGQPAAIHWPGAITITLAAALVMVAANAVPQRFLAGWASGGLAGAGVLCAMAYCVLSSRTAQPLIKPRLIVEPRFLRSVVAAAAQMFALATVVIAVPLYLTGLGRSTAVTGALVFALPATMAIGAPAVGALSDRSRPRMVLRTGLCVLIAAMVLLGWFTGRAGQSLPVLALLLVAVGVGVALVQTPSATGATKSPAGQSGAALGLFNMARFGSSALGAAWVAVMYPRGALLALFAGAACALAAALAVSFAGPDPQPTA